MTEETIQPTFDAWRDAARDLLIRDVPPSEVIWTDNRPGSTGGLPFPEPRVEEVASKRLMIPRDFMADAKLASCFRADDRWSFLYRVAYRITHGEPNLMSIAVDADVTELRNRVKAIRRDNHKMHAFVRFRKIEDEDANGARTERFVAFHRPDHHIVRLTTPFFVERFRVMRWAILTPDESVEWDTKKLVFGPGVSSRDAPQEDDVEGLWLTYYRNIFNPARLKVKHMVQELPKRHWRTLPEAALIPELIKSANTRSEEMQSVAAERAKYDVPPVPKSHSLTTLRSAAKTCLACPWAAKCTQTVFGRGPDDAKIVLVGEQPGDMEDREGKPFVGPAGQMLRGIIEETGVDIDSLYVTNAVKHFKFEERGMRRIHQTPSARDVSVCKPWLVSELEAIKPSVLVCLGATAAKSVLGNGFRITQSRGEILRSEWSMQTIATYHPSAILRVPDRDAAEEMRGLLAKDLRTAFGLAQAG